jgi:PAS domain S-box-containing protein
MLNGSVAGQNDDDLVSYKTLLNISSYPEETRALIIELEEKWYCTNKRNQLLGKLKDIKNQDIQFNNYVLIMESARLLNDGNFKDSRIVLDQVEGDENAAVIHYMKGCQHGRQKQYSKAIIEYNIALSIFVKRKNSLGTILTKSKILNVYCKLENYKAAESYYLDLISISQRYNYEKGLMFAYSYYGPLIAQKDLSYSYDVLYRGYELSKKFELSLQIRFDVVFLKFLVRYGYYKDFKQIYSHLNTLVLNSCYVGKYSIINTLYAFWLSTQGKTDSAKKYNQFALQQRKVYGNQIFIGFSYLNIFSNYLAEKKYDTAKIYLDSAQVLLANKHNDPNRRTYLKYLLKYYKAINMKDSTIATFEKIIDLNGRYYNEQQNEYSAKLNENFKIRALLEEEKYQANIKHQKAKFWYTLIISILLGVLLLGLLILFAKKSRNFRILKLSSYSKNKKLKDYEYELSQLKRVFQNDIAGLFFVDENTNIRYVNNKGKDLLSSVNEIVLTQSILDFIGDEFQKDFANCIQDVMKTGASKEIQSNIAKEPNSWVNFSISPLFNGDKIESVLILGVDITERVRALETEKKQKTILQSLFNSVTESILLLDKDGKIKYINQTGANRIGKLESELIGRNYIDVLSTVLQKERANQIQESIKKKGPIIYSENIDSFNNLVSIYPSFNEKGQLEHISEFTHDITENKLAHEQINSLRQKVLRSQMNPHFIFNSLNAIQSYVLKNDSELAVKYLNSFAKLIRMILDSSRFDYISLKKEINILEYYLQLQQLRFGDRFSWSMDVDKKIDLDSILIPVMLAQPFIENAIEHGLQHLTTQGQVKISFVRASDSIIFKVSDNGIGREASKKLKKNNKNTTQSLSTQLFKERLFTLNKYSGRKITYDIIDVKDNDDNARGTLVIINLPIMYRTNIV